MNIKPKQKSRLPRSKGLLLAGIMIVGVSSTALAADAVVNQPMLNDTGIALAFMSLMILQIIIITVVADSIKNLAGSKSLWLTAKKRDSDEKPGGNNVVITLIILLGFSMLSNNLFAAGETINEPLIVLSDTLYWMLIGINVLLFGLLMYLLSILKGMIKLLQGEEAGEATDSVMDKLTDAVAIEDEAEIMMDHEYDGIRELDNNLPPWWVYMFYITIIFGVVYIVHYHISPIKMFEKVAIIGPGVGQEKLYKLEVEEAQRAKEEYMARMLNLVDETNVELLTDLASVKKGADVFKANCTPCHGQSGEGNTIGPNLADEYWLNGGGIKNVFTTIKYGVPEKGMIAWQAQFSPSQIQQMASFVLSLQGTNPENGKDSQGELWKEEVVSGVVEVAEESELVLTNDSTETE